MLSTSTPTAFTRQTINPNDRRKFPSGRICSIDGQLFQPKSYVNMQNLCPSNIWLRNILTPTKKWCLCQRFPSKKNWHSKSSDIFLGNAETSHQYDSRSVTRFFQIKIIPPPIWDACDFVFTKMFTIAHNTGKMNFGAHFISRLETVPNKKIILRIREDAPTQRIEVNIESTGKQKKTMSFFTLMTMNWHLKSKYGNASKENE